MRVLFFLLFLSALLHAQSDSLDLSTVVVTADKFPTPVKEVPRQVTVIDSATIARNVTGDLSQLLQQELGVVMTGAYANPGSNKAISLRGATSEYTLILVDGVPVTDPSAIGSVLDLRLISLDQLERVEILRGPASLLYGADATAGVINLITKRDKADGFRGNVRASYGSLNTRQTAVGLHNGSEHVDFDVNFDHYKTDGISEARRPEGSTDTFDADGAVRTNLSAAITLRAGRYLTIRPAVRYADFDGDFDTGAFQDGSETYTNELSQPSLAVDYARKDLALAARLSRVRSRRSFQFAFGPFDYDGRNTVADVYGRYALGEKVGLLAGVQSRREEVLPTAEGVDAFKATTTSPYAQLNYSPTDRLTAEAGFRYNDHSAFGGQSNFSVATRYALTTSLSSRLSVSSGHQNPTLDQLFGPFGANPELAPQVVTAGEAGISYQNLRTLNSLTATVFRRTTKDIIIFDFAEGYQNRGELRDWGLELGGTVYLLPRFQLDAGLSYTRGQLTAPDGMGGETETEEFLRRPDLKMTAGATYENRTGLLLRVSALRIGARADRYFDEDFAGIDVTLDPYLIANFYAEQKLLRQDRLRLFVDIRNVLDTVFSETAGFGTVGRTVNGGVSWAF